MKARYKNLPEEVCKKLTALGVSPSKIKELERKYKRNQAQAAKAQAAKAQAAQSDL